MSLMRCCRCNVPSSATLLRGLKSLRFLTAPSAVAMAYGRSAALVRSIPYLFSRRACVAGSEGCREKVSRSFIQGTDRHFVAIQYTVRTAVCRQLEGSNKYHRINRVAVSRDEQSTYPRISLIRCMPSREECTQCLYGVCHCMW